MLSITLPPELEAALSEQARAQNTTPELLALDSLHQWFVPAAPPEPAYSPEPDTPPGETLYDFLQGYIGVIDSSDIYPEGSSLSEDTGRKFAEGMVEKRRQGKL